MKRGFTIVELIVIIVVLTLLVGLGFFGYRSWRQDSMRSAIEAELKTVASTMEMQKNFTNSYPSEIPPSYIQKNPDVRIVMKRSEERRFCVYGTMQPLSTIQLHYDSKEGAVHEGDCAL